MPDLNGGCMKRTVQFFTVSSDQSGAAVFDDGICVKNYAFCCGFQLTILLLKFGFYEYIRQHRRLEYRLL